MMRSTRTWRSPAAAASLAALLSVVTACGDDSNGPAAPAGGTAPAGTEHGQGDHAFCDAYLEFQARGPEAPDEGAPEAEVRSFVDGIRPSVERMRDSAPADVRNSVQTFEDALDRAEDSGDAADLQSPEIDEAFGPLGRAAYDNCDADRLEVTAVDYRYEDVPSTVGAGLHAFKLVNDGNEPHEMILLRKKEGVDESVEELLELSEEEAFAKVDFVGVAWAQPGEDGYAVAELLPGDYAMVCFIPVGSSGDAPPAEGDEASGPPHFTQGMLAQFTVR